MHERHSASYNWFMQRAHSACVGAYSNVLHGCIQCDSGYLSEFGASTWERLLFGRGQLYSRYTGEITVIHALAWGIGTGLGHIEHLGT